MTGASSATGTFAALAGRNTASASVPSGGSNPFQFAAALQSPPDVTALHSRAPSPAPS